MLIKPQGIIKSTQALEIDRLGLEFQNCSVTLCKCFPSLSLVFSCLKQTERRHVYFMQLFYGFRDIPCSPTLNCEPKEKGEQEPEGLSPATNPRLFSAFPLARPTGKTVPLLPATLPLPQTCRFPLPTEGSVLFNGVELSLICSISVFWIIIRNHNVLLIC